MAWWKKYSSDELEKFVKRNPYWKPEKEEVEAFEKRVLDESSESSESSDSEEK